MNILLEVIYLKMLFFRKEKSYFEIHRFLNKSMKNQIKDTKLKGTQEKIFLEQISV